MKKKILKFLPSCASVSFLSSNYWRQSSVDPHHVCECYATMNYAENIETLVRGCRKNISYVEEEKDDDPNDLLEQKNKRIAKTRLN